MLRMLAHGNGILGAQHVPFVVYSHSLSNLFMVIQDEYDLLWIDLPFINFNTFFIFMPLPGHYSDIHTCAVALH